MNRAQYAKASTTLDEMGEIYLYNENESGLSRSITWRSTEYSAYGALMLALGRLQSFRAWLDGDHPAL